MLWKVLDGLSKSLDGCGLFGKVLSGVGSGWFWAFLGSSGRLWMGGGRAYGALNATLERIWMALDGFDRFERGLGGCGRLWAALGSFE